LSIFGLNQFLIQELFIKVLNQEYNLKQLAGIERGKCFKELRTTYLSALQVEYGDINLTSTVIVHSNKEVARNTI